VSTPTTPTGGGFHFGSVGGLVNLSAGGDIVGGNKIETTNIYYGAPEAAKARKPPSCASMARSVCPTMRK
jgi:hypothetical protein